MLMHTIAARRDGMPALASQSAAVISSASGARRFGSAEAAIHAAQLARCSGFGSLGWKTRLRELRRKPGRMLPGAARDLQHRTGRRQHAPQDAEDRLAVALRGGGVEARVHQTRQHSGALAKEGTRWICDRSFSKAISCGSSRSSRSTLPACGRRREIPRSGAGCRFASASEAEASQLIAFASAAAAKGAMLAFAQILRASGEIMGSTSYLAVEPAHRRLEIGATWLNPRHQRTGANTEAKLLLLRHAFETLGCERVEFKTDSREQGVARRARAHRRDARRAPCARTWGASTASRRDSVYFGVIAPEWPHVRAHLEGLLARARSRQTR